MSNWNRGRKQSTPERKKEMEDWQRERVKIANLVSRNKEIKKECCICGSEQAKILHNRQDPYYITFICDECRKEESNLEYAEEFRFDVRTKLNKKSKSTDNFTQEECVRIVIGYMNELLSIGDYCDKIGISRHQFSNLLKQYKKLFPKQHIDHLVSNHSNRIQKEKTKYRIEQQSIHSVK